MIKYSINLLFILFINNYKHQFCIRYHCVTYFYYYSLQLKNLLDMFFYCLLLLFNFKLILFKLNPSTKMQNPPGSLHPDNLNQNLKKSILWNSVQPGDPYDVRKYTFKNIRSMIAKLPGDKKPFMGNKLQLICLLQAG